MSYLSVMRCRFFSQTDGSNNNVIRYLVLSTGVVTTIAGKLGGTVIKDGIGTSAEFSYLNTVSLSSSGTFALIVS
jgi:hypothetical protein